MTTITKEKAQKIIDAADEVLSALAGANDAVHPDDSKKMCALWDDLNDRHAPPEVVRELARIALATLDSAQEPAASCIVENGCMCIDGFGEYVGHSLRDGVHELYAAPHPLTHTECAELQEYRNARGEPVYQCEFCHHDGNGELQWH